MEQKAQATKRDDEEEAFAFLNALFLLLFFFIMGACFKTHLPLVGE
jgi:hypothetical protein